MCCSPELAQRVCKGETINPSLSTALQTLVRTGEPLRYVQSEQPAGHLYNNNRESRPLRFGQLLQHIKSAPSALNCNTIPLGYPPVPVEHMPICL